ncbi:hypothetical protein AGMMS49975_07240 [Clostridia bacterium]|nr:hypothetical protein AGMMS49975_07240 [Clostridia bacterium]
MPDMFIAHEQDYLKRYSEEDEKGRYFWDTFARPGLKHPIVYDIVAPDGTVINNGWIHSKERFEQEYKDGEVRVTKKLNGEWSVQFKQRLNEKGKKPRSMTMDFGGTSESKKELGELFDNEKIFSYPKSAYFIKALLETCTNDGDIIFDFFSGSATTAHAVMQLNAEDGGNRRFICVQLPELCDEKSEAYKAGYKNICEIGKERIRRAGAKIKAENQLTAPNLDTGFRAFKLDTSNLKAWDTSPIREKDPAAAAKILLDRLRAHIDILNPDRSDLDVTFEVMLKFGQDLCEAVTPLNINGKTVYGVCANVKFIVCLAPDVSAEDAEEMAKYAPGRIVFADSCFDNTEQKTNVKLILRDKGITIKAL